MIFFAARTKDAKRICATCLQNPSPANPANFFAKRRQIVYAVYLRLRPQNVEDVEALLCLTTLRSPFQDMDDNLSFWAAASPS